MIFFLIISQCFALSLKDALELLPKSVNNFKAQKNSLNNHLEYKLEYERADDSQEYTLKIKLLESFLRNDFKKEFLQENIIKNLSDKNRSLHNVIIAQLYIDYSYYLKKITLLNKSISLLNKTLSSQKTLVPSDNNFVKKYLKTNDLIIEKKSELESLKLKLKLTKKEISNFLGKSINPKEILFTKIPAVKINRPLLDEVKLEKLKYDYKLESENNNHFLKSIDFGVSSEKVKKGLSRKYLISFNFYFPEEDNFERKKINYEKKIKTLTLTRDIEDQFSKYLSDYKKSAIFLKHLEKINYKKKLNSLRGLNYLEIKQISFENEMKKLDHFYYALNSSLRLSYLSGTINQYIESLP